MITAVPVRVRVPVTVVALDKVKVYPAIDKEPRVGRYAPEKVVSTDAVNAPVQVRALARVIVEVLETVILFQVILLPLPASVFNVQLPFIFNVELVVVTVPWI